MGLATGIKQNQMEANLYKKFRIRRFYLANLNDIISLTRTGALVLRVLKSTVSQQRATMQEKGKKYDET